MPKGEKPMDLPAGHERDEAERKVADELQEEIETRQARDGIEPLDASKFARRDNEILGQLDSAGFIPIENREAGKRYVFLTAADGYPDNAKANIRQMHADAKRFGLRPVEGKDNPVAANLMGHDVAGGTTLRAVGDTVLFEQTEEMAQQMEMADQRKLDNQMAVEENSVVYASERLSRAGLPNTMHGVAGDFGKDPLMGRMAGSAGHTETFQYNPNRTNFTEGDLRRGSMPGPDGRTLQPGFDARRFR
jgi:hypothetical protein